MKRLLLFLTGVFMITSAMATNVYHENDNNKKHRYAQPIVFFERGIEFLVFPDGGIDFDLGTYNVYNVRDSRRTSINASYNGPRVSLGFTTNKFRHPYIIKDRYGNVTRIDNVLINYDHYGRVVQVGNVYIDYGRGRNGTLTRVGGLSVNYNSWGEIVHVRGHVNDDLCNICGVNDCHMDHGHLDVHHNNQWFGNNYDDNYYYYKKGGNIIKQKKNKH